MNRPAGGRLQRPAATAGHTLRDGDAKEFGLEIVPPPGARAKAFGPFNLRPARGGGYKPNNFSTSASALSSILMNAGQVRGKISIPQILGFSTPGVNVMFNLRSVTSTLTLST